MIGTNRYIGSPVERIEDLRFLRGRCEFVGDLQRGGMLHAAILRSPIAHGRIRGLDSEPARAIPGVRDVIAAAEIGAVPTIPLRLLPLPGTERFLQPVIATGRLRYVGEPIAVVLADSAALAEDGVGALILDLEELPPVPDRRASGRHEILLFEESGTNLAMTFTGVLGDAEAAFRDAPYVRRECFEVQRHTALPMEPRGLLAEWDSTQQRMTVLGAAKVPFFNRDTLAAMLGLAPASVDLIENDVGGGFGARGEFYPEDFLIPFAARHVGRPVRWLEDRREHLTAMNHARQADCEVEIACRRDGTILGMRGDIFVDLGAYVRTNGLIQPRTLAQCFSGPYRVPNLHMVVRALLTNKTPSGTYRGPGRYEASFFCERLIELAAVDLGLDSAEMRRRNLIGAAEMPYKLARLEPGGAAVDTECDSGDYGEVLERCLAEFAWEDKRTLQGRLIDGRYHGIAVACFIEGAGAGPKEAARLELEPDGTVAVYVGSAAVGQGLETVMAQVAADTLGTPIDLVRVFLVVEDVGRIVNPLTLHGQAIGGIVQGLGGAFMENLVYDANGQLLTGTLADYLIPTASDFPRIRAIALENHPSPSNPLGVKGAGEGPIIPVGGLMANAVGNALASFGAMPNQLPLSPARVWRMGAEAPVENLGKNARAEPVSDAAGPGRSQIRR